MQKFSEVGDPGVACAWDWSGICEDVCGQAGKLLIPIKIEEEKLSEVGFDA